MNQNFGGDNFAYQYGKFQTMERELNELRLESDEAGQEYELSKEQYKRFKSCLCSLIAMDRDLSNMFVKYYRKKYAKQKPTFRDLKKFITKEVSYDNLTTILLNYNCRLEYSFMKNNGSVSPEDHNWINEQLFREVRVAARKSNNKVDVFEVDEMLILHEHPEE